MPSIWHRRGHSETHRQGSGWACYIETDPLPWLREIVTAARAVSRWLAGQRETPANAERAGSPDQRRSSSMMPRARASTSPLACFSRSLRR
jgi:hypothetical protein